MRRTRYVIGSLLIAALAFGGVTTAVASTELITPNSSYSGGENTGTEQSVTMSTWVPVQL